MRQRDRMGEEALRVRTLGRFSIAWKDTMVVGGTSYNESQFTYLMQILLHAGKKGVSRSELEEALFEGRELNNVRHATQSVIYNAKKRLRRSGLPDVNFIEQRDGIFYCRRPGSDRPRRRPCMVRSSDSRRCPGGRAPAPVPAPHRTDRPGFCPERRRSTGTGGGWGCSPPVRWR